MNDRLDIDYTTHNGTRRLSWHIEDIKTNEQVISELEHFLSLIFNQEYIIKPKVTIRPPKKLLVENKVAMTEEIYTNDELIEKLRNDYYKSKGYHEAEQFEFSFLKDVENGDAFEYMDSLHSKV